MYLTSPYDEILKILKKRGFKSSIRIAIMIYLLFKNKIYFTDLVKTLNITPGNLWSHLEKLRDEGFVEVKYTISDRPRVVICITDKGLKETISLLRNMINVFNQIPEKEKK